MRCISGKPDIGLWFLYLVTLSFVFSGCHSKLAGTSSTKAATTHPTFYPTAQAYLQARQKLVATDSIQDFDAQIALSAEEQQLNEKLVALRKQMIQQYDAVNFFPPAHNFYKSQEHIYTTPLFQVLKKMPKGGIHHFHPTAGLSFEWVINRALQEPGCYVYWQKDNEQYIRGQMHFYKKDEVPEGFYAIQQLNDSIAGFKNQLYQLFTFNASEANDSVDIWYEFERCFRRTGGFTTYQPVFQDFYTACFDSLLADGIQHAELRVFLGGSLYDLIHSPGSFPADSIIHYLEQAATLVRQKSDPAFTYQLIYTNVRFRPLDIIKQDLPKAFAIRAKYPHLVKAYDLVAEEDAGNSTLYFLEAWQLRDSLAKVYKINMPLCLHDGESNWEHVSNVYDAVLLGSTRIGHGFNLSFFPAAEEMIRQRNICIEVSPLSNQILGYIGDLRMHPAHAWIKRGIQISINSDDPAIFQYTGTTPDYWSIFLAWELDLRALKKLSMNAIEYSLLDAPEKKKALQVWESRWQRFVSMANASL